MAFLWCRSINSILEKSKNCQNGSKMRHTGLFILSFIGDKNSNIPSFLSTFWCPLFFFLFLMVISYTKKEKKYHFHIIIENMIWKKNCSGGESNPRSFSYGAKVQTTTPTGLAIITHVYEKTVQSITFLKILIFFYILLKIQKPLIPSDQISLLVCCLISILCLPPNTFSANFCKKV